MNGEQRKHVSAEVNDISEGGFSIVLADPCYIPSENLDVLLNTESQCVQARGAIISVRSGQNEYRYTFKFIENDTPERKNTLLRIIHNGKPTLPSRLRDDYSVALDWLRNLRIRLLQSPRRENRLQPRFPGFVPGNGAKPQVKNFNYMFALLDPAGTQLPREIEISLPFSGYSIKCIQHSIKDNENILYRIMNLDEIPPAFPTGRRGNAPGTMPQEQEEEDFDEKQFL
jgi:hypothetical protein